MLSPRLFEAAKSVRPGSVAADIGTDHALLPIFLIKSGICPRAIASDIRSGPLRRASENIAAHGLTDEIECRRGSGLDILSPGEGEDIIIAGMGGELIFNIIDRAPFVRERSIRLILQPMTKAHFLRRRLAEAGFDIIRESAVSDSGRFYSVMTANYTGIPRIISESAAYLGNIENSPEKSGYLKNQAAKLERKIQGLRKSGDPAAVFFEKIRDDIQREIVKFEK